MEHGVNIFIRIKPSTEISVPIKSRCRAYRTFSGGNWISPITIYTLIFSFASGRHPPGEFSLLLPPRRCSSPCLPFSFVNSSREHIPIFSLCLFLPLHALLFLPTPSVCAFSFRTPCTPLRSTLSCRSKITPETTNSRRFLAIFRALAGERASQLPRFTRWKIAFEPSVLIEFGVDGLIWTEWPWQILSTRAIETKRRVTKEGLMY